jgi:tRNA A37 threonylcarbamoyladenosine biosynthesis protein TsaE
MGAGKSTFARFLLESLRVAQPPEGSPSFAIAHEYELPSDSSTRARKVAHVDLYRIKTEDEIEEAGLSEVFWERSVISLCEWASLWPGFEAALKRPAPSSVVWDVKIAFKEGEPSLRSVAIEKIEA